MMYSIIGANTAGPQLEVLSKDEIKERSNLSGVGGALAGMGLLLAVGSAGAKGAVFGGLGLAVVGAALVAASR